ncbi:MAG: hypothetical protein ACI4O8_01460 [Aristaeellaceae bacterium]|nr:hypothetical protein [Eubacteriales bacterium]
MSAASGCAALYASEDLQRAGRCVRRNAWTLGGAEIALLAAYAAATALDLYWGMLALLLAAFIFALFWGDLRLLPALRYQKFLRELNAGLRRSAVCRVESLEDAAQMQDGVQVRVLHVCLAEHGEERIFYLNAEHAARFPGPGTQIVLESCGRHVTGVCCAQEERT